MKKDFKKVLTALITPFRLETEGAHNGGAARLPRLCIDWVSLERLVKSQLKHGIQGFVINGTTAESPNLSAEERVEIFKKVKALSKEDTLLVMGTGTNSTASTIEQTIKAAELGADAALVVVPYYNKPPQRGLILHFEAIANESKIPIILYNVPGRTVAKLDADTIAHLSRHPNIIGIKEATGDMEFLKKIISMVPKDFILLSGDDSTYEKFLSFGGHGVISVATHVIPRAMLEGKIEKYLPLIDQLFCEANPIPVKKALQEMGLIDQAFCRSPLVEMDKDLAQKMVQTMKNLGVL